MNEYRNKNTFFQKVTFQIGLKRFLWLKKLKILCHGHMLLVTLMVKKLLERFAEKNCIKGNQKVIKKKGHKLCQVE